MANQGSGYGREYFCHGSGHIHGSESRSRGRNGMREQDCSHEHGRRDQKNENWGVIEEHESGHGSYRRHAGVGTVPKREENRTFSNSEMELLDRIHDLELLVRLVRGENMDLRKVVSQMYNFAFSAHNEIKAQNSSLVGKIENIKETLEMVYPRKKKKAKVTESEMEVISREMEKLKKYMENAGNYVDLCIEQNPAANTVGATKDAGPS